jgi:serine/threonine-protein kinase
VERVRWRKQAREWLRADLAGWAKMMNSNSQADRDLARKMLTHWRVEPDLAGLREPAELKKLSEDERRDCIGLWSDVSAVLGLAQSSQ